MSRATVLEAVGRLQPGLLSCPVAGCDERLWVPDLWVVYRTFRSNYPPYREWVKPYVEEDRFTCSTHWPQRLTGGPITGLWRPEIACGEACRWAAGRVCRCSCRGLAHGTGWAAPSARR